MKMRVIHDDGADVPDLGTAYMHCGRCLDERPTDVSPKDWARQQVALTRDGIQVWCTRHEMNIDLIRFSETE